ncbi:MAG: glycosyltransferase [Burkholderiales bacterium]|nr:glycosyltransferase [Burkholderiales bacterium]
MKLVHVVPHIDEEASGPSYSAPRLCESLAARGHEVELSCLAARTPIAGVHIDVHREWPVFRRFAVSPSHARALRGKAKVADVVHNHSLWSMVNMASGLIVPSSHAKLVTSPRGTLSSWALGRRRHIKCALWPLQRRALFCANLIHATSQEEYEEIRALGLRVPVAIIPNGVDVPPEPMRHKAGGRRTLLYLGRLHPKKGLETLCEAWKSLQGRYSEWDLHIVGHGQPEYESRLKRLTAGLELERVEFRGPLYGDAKREAYFEASLFVLPTQSENFGMVVAEALAHGCPAVVSKGAPWSGLERARCGWWVGRDANGLMAGLDAAMSTPREALVEMGKRGREWMRRDFGWSAIAEQMELTYAWVLERAGCPRWVERA